MIILKNEFRNHLDKMMTLSKTPYQDTVHLNNLTTAHSTHTHTHPFKGPLSRITRVSQYQKGNTILDFTEARDSEWQWHQLGHTRLHLAPDR